MLVIIVYLCSPHPQHLSNNEHLLFFRTSAHLVCVYIGDDGGCFAEANDGKGCRGLSTSSWDGQHVFLFVVSLYVLLCECNEYTYEWVYGLSACVVCII